MTIISTVFRSSNATKVPEGLRTSEEVSAVMLNASFEAALMRWASAAK
jgi:hypothetical protein